VLKESSPPPIVLSLGICPSGWMPCSRQYNSQQALPICTPAWPAWIEIHSRYRKSKIKFSHKSWNLNYIAFRSTGSNTPFGIYSNWTFSHDCKLWTSIQSLNSTAEYVLTF
jgi:hypothetical protein